MVYLLTEALAEHLKNIIYLSKQLFLPIPLGQ